MYTSYDCEFETSVTTRRIKYWYTLFNKRYFGGRLPGVVIRIGEIPGKLADVSQDEKGRYIIRFSVWPLGSMQYVKWVLLHEMCHLKAGIDAGHDSKPYITAKRELIRKMVRDGYIIKMF